MALIEVRLRPSGPWRVGHHAGDRQRVDVIYHSDALYSAVTHAMRALGRLEEWLDVTARATEPAVRLSSLFPYVGKVRLVAPPKSVWPPANPGRLYLAAAKLVPLEVITSGVIEESRWMVDGESGCMIPTGGSAPFQVSLRTAAAVDRLTGAAEAHRTACLEYGPSAGLWGLIDAADDWEVRVKSAFRLLADSGFGGERSRGWGRASEPRFSDASHLGRTSGKTGLWWLLSAYSPSDNIDWTRSEFAASVRGGWTDSPAGAAPKKQVRLIEEGSVLSADSLRGRAVDVAPEGFPHPVYRMGFALALPAPAEIVVRATEPRSTQPAAPEQSEPADAATTAPEIASEPQPTAPEHSELPNTAPAAPEAGTEPQPATPEHAEPAETASAAPEPPPMEVDHAESALPTAEAEPATEQLDLLPEPESEPHEMPEPVEPLPIEESAPAEEPAPDPPPTPEPEAEQ